MSHNGRFVEDGTTNKPQDLRGENGLQTAHTSQQAADTASRAKHYADLQSAARFPIKLPVFVKSKSGESRTETENISANGVLFQMDSAMPVGSAVDFTISLPAEIVGADADVRLDCRGRVARSFTEGNR